MMKKRLLRIWITSFKKDIWLLLIEIMAVGFFIYLDKRTLSNNLLRVLMTKKYQKCGLTKWRVGKKTRPWLA